jgi:hypothetical protein
MKKIILFVLIILTYGGCENDFFVPYQEFQILNKSNDKIIKVGIEAVKNNEKREVLTSAEILKILEQNDKTNISLDLKKLNYGGDGLFIPYAIKSNGEKITIAKNMSGYYFIGRKGRPFAIPYEIVNNIIILNDSLNNKLNSEALKKTN